MPQGAQYIIDDDPPAPFVLKDSSGRHLDYPACCRNQAEALLADLTQRDALAKWRIVSPPSEAPLL